LIAVMIRFWHGQMRIHTLATMIVPSMAPTWMKAARPLKVRQRRTTTPKRRT